MREQEAEQQRQFDELMKKLFPQEGMARRVY
jgi:hypothetical protein